MPEKRMPENQVFKNRNGREYIIIAGDNRKALLREVDRSGYVIAWGLDWENMCWQGGNYFGADEFEAAVKIFIDGREDEQ